MGGPPLRVEAPAGAVWRSPAGGECQRFGAPDFSGVLLKCDLFDM